jgi:anti-sigma factor RsiW
VLFLEGGTLSCKFLQGSLNGYFDRELDSVQAAEAELHLETCAECRRSLREVTALHFSLQNSDLYERATPQLYTAIRKQLKLDVPSQRNFQFFPRPRFWAPVFATLGVALAVFVLLFLFKPDTNDGRITAELIDAHMRSLQPGHLTDVQSSEQLTPWFEGKLKFAPPLSDRSDQGFALVGARLDVIDGDQIPVVVYSRGQHLINVFVWPYNEKELRFGSTGSKREYNWVMWSQGNVAFCAVSDASISSLQELEKLIQAST